MPAKRVLHRLRSEEFEDVMNQEFNFALFARRTITQYALDNQELIGEVREKGFD